MKNKKGFTLVEMLLTLCILAIISLIVVPNIVSTFKRARDNEYQRFLSDIFLSTEAYVQKNIDKYPDLNAEGNSAYVYVEDLLKSKYLKSSLYDPKNKVKISTENYFTVEVIVKDDGSYTYKLYEELVDPNYCEYEAGKEWTFDYTGSEQDFNVPCNGNYKIETWGAQGGSYDTTYYGGYGAYATGNIQLSKDEKLYVNSGGIGLLSNNALITKIPNGGYNGGGGVSQAWTGDTAATQKQASGGGATHISKTSGILSSLSTSVDNILVVAAGGGGAEYNVSTYYGEYDYSTGGAGGGISGYDGISEFNHTAFYELFKSTQTSGGYLTYNGTTYGQGLFGQGGSFMTGGGGGYYGGFGGSYSGGGGGSSYIGNILLANKAIYCYNCTESTDESTKTISTTNVSSTPTSNYAKKGNGYAKITYLGI